MKRVILDEVQHARASTEAGSRDRERSAARSRSRIRSPLASRNASRDRKDLAHGQGASELAPPVPDMPSVPKTEIPSPTAAAENSAETSHPENGVTRKDLHQNAQVGELALA